MNIKILGPGCPKCRQTATVAENAVRGAGVDAVVEKVTDMLDIAGYGVFGTPAVVVDGEVKCVGKVPSAAEVAGWISGAAGGAPQKGK